MRKRVSLTAVFFCLLFFPVLLSPLNQRVYPPTKDPYFAAALSWFVPGLGQAYTGKPLRGGLFWIIDTGLFWGTILNIADVDLQLNSDVGFSIAIKLKRKPSTGRVIATVGLGLAYLGFHFYNMIDAANGALAYNDRIYRTRLRREGLSFNVAQDFSGVSHSWGF